MNSLQQIASLALLGGEELVKQAQNVTLCDAANEESNFTGGGLTLTTHRLLWRDVAGDTVLALNLSLVQSATLDPTRNSQGFPRLHLSCTSPPPAAPGHSLKLLFCNYGAQLFLSFLTDAIQRRKWEIPLRNNTQPCYGYGIEAIERKVEMENKSVDKTLGAAFADVRQLMDKAQEMVGLSRKLAEKIRDSEKGAGLGEDETAQFKSVLLSMGIANPVTRQTAGGETKFHKQLAHELSQFLLPLLKQEVGGTMSLADVYCRVNRARGVDLISPDDVLLACCQFDKMQLPLYMRTFDSGVCVVQLREVRDERVIAETLSLVQHLQHMSAEDLAHRTRLSVTLAKERLLLAESEGHLCRDETVEGLTFYPNKFVDV